MYVAIEGRFKLMKPMKQISTRYQIGLAPVGLFGGAPLADVPFRAVAPPQHLGQTAAPI